MGPRERNRPANAPSAPRDIWIYSAPRLVALVFLRQAHDNRIAPHVALWPAFFGAKKDGQVVPLPLAKVREAFKAADEGSAPAQPGGAPAALDAPRLAKVLAALAPRVKDQGEAVYIGQGRLRRLAMDGTLGSEEHPAAQPYAWALGHEVRPAQDALGAGGCQECHSTKGAIYFGLATSGNGEPGRRMFELRGEGRRLTGLSAFSYGFRPYFKGLMLAALAVVAAVVAVQACGAVRGALRWLKSGKDEG